MMRILPAVLVTVLMSCLFYTTVRGDCPSGWEHFNESCYQFVRRERSWTAAEVYCIRHGARLAKIETSEENDYLRKYLNDNQRYFAGLDMWLGAKGGSGGTWTWADKTTLSDDDYNDWQTGQPDLNNPQACLEFESEYSNHWNDDYCDELNYHICERPFHPLTPPPIPAETLVG